MAVSSNEKSDKTKVIGVGRLKEIYELIPEDRKKIAQDLIKEILFMATTLNKLKTNIRKQGPTVEFINGKQQMMIENPAMKTYNTLIQRYGTFFKQLNELIPKNPTVKSEDDGFDDFVEERSDI